LAGNLCSATNHGAKSQDDKVFWCKKMSLLNNKSPRILNAVFAVVLALGLALPTVSFASDPLTPELDGSNVATEVSASPDINLAAANTEEDVNDPIEPVNRVIFEFNEVIQDAILRPVAKFYNDTVPVTIRQGVSNFLDNLATPIVLANDILQGEFERALQTVGRALVNSTVGFLGFADVAAELGVERHDEDFGQTLGAHGVGEGFYLVLPIFGPSNPRDLVGKFIVDPFFDPVGLWIDNTDRDELGYTLDGVDGLDEYAGIVDELNQVKKTSVDYYAAVRSLYRQKRKTEIRNGSTLELPPIPDLGYNIAPENLDQSLAVIEQPSVQ